MKDVLNLAGVVSPAAVIAYYSLADPGAAPAPGGASFPVLHVAAYLSLAAALAVYLHRRKHSRWIAFLVAVSFGAGLELAQLQLPYRAFSAADIGFNALGASFVVADKRIGSVDIFLRLEDRVLEDRDDSF